MVAQLQEEQFELDGYLFGAGTGVAVLADGLDYGSAEVRSQDADRPQGDGSMFGRDYFGGPEWSFTLGVRHGLDVWSVMEPLTQAWRADSVRSQPGAMSVLRYRRNGQTYRMLGRPRKFGISQGHIKRDDFQQVACTFQLANPEAYIEPAAGSTSRSLTLRLIQADSGGGVVWDDDLVWPIEFDETSQARVGEVTVGGSRPAPFQVVVHGPVTGTLSGISLSGDGWSLQTSATLQHDQTLVVDTAANTITKAGVSQAGTLSRTSRLTSRLTVGHQFIQFNAIDPSNTAYAVVTWRDTVPA